MSNNPNDALPIFPSYDAPGGHGALLDHVQPVRVKDHADGDVRAAMQQVSANENRHRLASELGLDGVTAAEKWNARIEQVGPSAAIEAAQLYASQPHLSARQEEDRQEDEHSRSARAAYRQVVEKERREANLPSALEGLDRLEQRHGSLNVLDTFKRWDSQLRENPQDAAPRVANEIATRINDSIAMQSAMQRVNEYRASYRVTSEEQPIMEQVLQSGQLQDLPTSHKYAQYVLATDVKDPFQRSVESARRERDPEILGAFVARAEFQRAHPEVQEHGPVWNRMRQLLNSGKARDLDDALFKATHR